MGRRKIPKRLPRTVGLARLQRELNRGTRRQVLDKYARKHPNGKIVFCTPSWDERTQQRVEKIHSKGKVIYDTPKLAKLAKRELQQRGAGPLEIYVCDRSRHGHCHLRTARYLRT
jgi:hypothetical protein